MIKELKRFLAAKAEREEVAVMLDKLYLIEYSSKVLRGKKDASNKK